MLPLPLKSIAVSSVQNVAGGYMARKLVKELVKIVPVVGKIAAEFIGSKVSAAMLTMVGWDIAETLSRKKETAEYMDL